MEQKLDHLKRGDLIIIQQGWNKHNYLCVFESASSISVTFYNIGSRYKEHIRTAHSKYQRVFKVSLDNLTKAQKLFYEETLDFMFEKKKKKIPAKRGVIKKVFLPKSLQSINPMFDISNF